MLWRPCDWAATSKAGAQACAAPCSWRRVARQREKAQQLLKDGTSSQTTLMTDYSKASGDREAKWRQKELEANQNFVPEENRGLVVHNPHHIASAAAIARCFS